MLNYNHFLESDYFYINKNILEVIVVSIVYTTGDMFQSNADCLVNPVT